MSEVRIGASCQQVCVVCNYGEELRKVDHKVWCAFRLEEHERPTDDARAAELCRPGIVYAAVNWMRSAITNYSKRVAPL
jgi:hypothetical protein